MLDSRMERYARLLIERSLNIQPKWQVLIFAPVLALPLVEIAVRLIAERGAHALVRLESPLLGNAWLKHASVELIETPTPINEFELTQMDACLTIRAPENKWDHVDVDPERRTAFVRSRATFVKRATSFSFPWVGCNCPIRRSRRTWA